MSLTGTLYAQGWNNFPPSHKMVLWAHKYRIPITPYSRFNILQLTPRNEEIGKRIVSLFHPCSPIHTVCSSKFSFSLSFFPRRQKLCRSLIMYRILLPCFMETPDWIHSSHRLESLKTSSDRNTNICFGSCIFNVHPAPQDLCQPEPECSFPPLEIIAC